MKKEFTIAFLIICFAASAQIRSKHDLETIAFVGYSFFWRTHDFEKKTSSLPTITFGVLGDYYINEAWSFHTGFTYQTMGGTDISYGEEFPANGKEKFGHITIPLHANFHFGGDRSFNINFGLTPTCLVDSKGIYPGAGLNSVNLRPVTYRFQLGAQAGIGYKVPLSKTICIMPDYQIFLGMTDTSKKPGENLKSTGHSFNIACVFGI